MPAQDIHASVVVTFHREGTLAHQTWLSLLRCRAAVEAAGRRVQFILSLDRADARTRRVVMSLPELAPEDAILEVDLGDLGLSRNHAVANASGTWIGICDGDDYLSANWLVRSLELAEASGSGTIWHPDWIVFFEGWHALSRQIGQDDPRFDRNALLVTNAWNSCSFAHRDVYLNCPYRVSRPGESGFGYEDWHWNCETLARGFVHRIATDTMHFVRRKASGSLTAAHVVRNALILPSQLFDKTTQ